MNNNINKLLEDLKEPLKEQGWTNEQIQELEKTYFNKSIMDDYHFDGFQFKVNISFVNESSNPDPQFNKNGDAGFDLRADLSEETDTYFDYDNDLSIDIKPNELKMVNTGLYFSLPQGYELQIRPRSGLVSKYKVTVANSPGTVDCVPEGTKISTPNGYKNIEEIFEEEKTIIYSYNEEQNIIEEDVIDDMWLVENLELIEITTEDDDVVKIPITKEIYTNNGWKLAGNLTEEDEILRFT